jgi:hypothetical protein
VNKRFVIILVALALVASAVIAVSLASFTTTSKTQIVASTGVTSDWLRLYSQGTDPTGSTIYARTRLLDGALGNYAATGSDGALAVDLGGYPDSNKSYPVTTVFAVVTPAQFPDPSVGQISVSVSLVNDASGEQPLTLPGLAPFGSATAGATSVTMAAGQRQQLNVTVRARKRFNLGKTYTPYVLVDVNFPGAPAGSLRYTVPVKVTNIGGE